MNSYLPEANHVAVRDGKILGVGSFEDLQKWGEFELNHQFSDKVLLPGFVEGHCHAPEGQVWEHTYLGFFGRRDPEGRQDTAAGMASGPQSESAGVHSRIYLWRTT